MAKQNYNRRNSGLLVPGDDSIALPKPRAPKPWYAGKFSPMPWWAKFVSPLWLNMGRRGRSCYCGCRSICPYTCDDSNTLQSPAPDEWLIEIEDMKEGTCADCNDLNDAFVASWVGHFDLSNQWVENGYCLWQHELEAPICGFTHVSFAMWCACEYLQVILSNDPDPYFTATIKYIYQADPAFPITPDMRWNNIERWPFYYDRWTQVGAVGCNFDQYPMPVSYAYLTAL